MDRKQLASTFLQRASSGDVANAFALAAPDFRHHNPFFAADPRALQQGMADAAKQAPHQHLEIQRVLGDGDLVAVHSKVTPQPGTTIAVVHIFRFDDRDRIVELWDIGQPVPAESPNAIGMF